MPFRTPMTTYLPSTMWILLIRISSRLIDQVNLSVSRWRILPTGLSESWAPICRTLTGWLILIIGIGLGRLSLDYHPHHMWPGKRNVNERKWFNRVLNYMLGLGKGRVHTPWMRGGTLKGLGRAYERIYRGPALSCDYWSPTSSYQKIFLRNPSEAPILKNGYDRPITKVSVQFCFPVCKWPTSNSGYPAIWKRCHLAWMILKRSSENVSRGRKGSLSPEFIWMHSSGRYVEGLKVLPIKWLEVGWQGRLGLLSLSLPLYKITLSIAVYEK